MASFQLPIRSFREASGLLPGSEFSFGFLFRDLFFDASALAAFGAQLV